MAKRSRAATPAAALAGAKPRVFVFSSSGALDIVDAIQRNLDKDAFVTAWPQGVFKLGNSPLDSLLKALDQADFGIFVFLPEDTVKVKGKKGKAVRDNVLFEFGLFLGRLGKDRAFYIVPRVQPQMHLPSNLTGVTAAEFDPSNPDLVSALGTACSEIRELIKKQSIVPRTATTLTPKMLADLGAVAPMIRSIIAGRSEYSIQVIASTGGFLYPALIENADFTGRLNLAIQFVNPDHPLRRKLPGHWPRESRHIIAKLAEFAATVKGRAHIEAWVYDHVPCIHGVLVDGKHLFLGYYRWKQGRKTFELVGAQAPYYYYQRDASTEDFFSVFEGWFSAPTCKRLSL